MSHESVAKAKRFLIGRIVDQATLDGVDLTKAELKTLEFAEATAAPEDIEAARAFDAQHDSQEFESKIAEILRRAYERDKKSGEDTAWSDALDALADEDIYLLVMVQKAGISGSTPFSFLLDWRLALAVLPTFIVLAAGIIVAFTPLGAKLFPNELLRLALFLLLLGAPLVLYGIGRRKIG
jgi:hypothetical protein